SRPEERRGLRHSPRKEQGPVRLPPRNTRGSPRRSAADLGHRLRRARWRGNARWQTTPSIAVRLWALSHQQQRPVVGCRHLALRNEARPCVAANRTPIVGRRIRVHLGDRCVAKQPIDERAHYRAPKTLSQLLGVSEKLIDAPCAVVRLVLPPALHTIDHNV